jgi:TonB family protein
VKIQGAARGARGPVAVLVVAMVAGTGCAPDEVAIEEPVLIENDTPFRYPIDLWDEGAEGETVVMVHVTNTGGVDSVYVIESSGHTAFDSAAVAGARQLRFVPARRDDRRVARWTRVPVIFQTNEQASAMGGAP